MAHQERVLVDMTVDAPADQVWAALRDTDRIRQWFGWDAPGLDPEIQHIFHTQATADDDARTLTWEDGDRLAVEEQDGTSRLHVVRVDHRGTSWDGAFDAVDEGWITFLQQLRFLVERHRGQYRRTVIADHLDLGTEGDALLDRLGLRDLGDNPVGSRYTVPGPDGTEITGEVYFQADLQLGLTVDQEGDALLVVSRTPPTSAPPHGTARFLLSLYDTDDDRAADVERRWTGWWADDIVNADDTDDAAG